MNSSIKFLMINSSRLLADAISFNLYVNAVTHDFEKYRIVYLIYLPSDAVNTSMTSEHKLIKY